MGSGFVDDRHECGDRWTHLSSGPFTMAPGDSQEVIGAYVIGQGYDALHGVAAVKTAAGYAKFLYLSNFNFERHYAQSIHKIPERFQLSRPYPNPFNESVTVDLELPRDCDMSLAIYNAAGQLIRNLYKGQNNSGTYHYTWDGKNHLGASVSSGVYLVKFSAPGVQGVQKILLIR